MLDRRCVAGGSRPGVAIRRDGATEWEASQTRERSRILPYLETDRRYAAYAIGDLEPRLFAQCTWAAS